MRIRSSTREWATLPDLNATTAASLASLHRLQGETDLELLDPLHHEARLWSYDLANEADWRDHEYRVAHHAPRAGTCEPPPQRMACTWEQRPLDNGHHVTVDPDCPGCVVALAQWALDAPDEEWTRHADGTVDTTYNLLVGVLHYGTPEMARLTDALIVRGVVDRDAIPQEDR